MKLSTLITVLLSIQVFTAPLFADVLCPSCTTGKEMIKQLCLANKLNELKFKVNGINAQYLPLLVDYFLKQSIKNGNSVDGVVFYISHGMPDGIDNKFLVDILEKAQVDTSDDDSKDGKRLIFLCCYGGTHLKQWLTLPNLVKENESRLKKINFTAVIGFSDSIKGNPDGIQMGGLFSKVDQTYWNLSMDNAAPFQIMVQNNKYREDLSDKLYKSFLQKHGKKQKCNDAANTYIELHALFKTQVFKFEKDNAETAKAYQYMPVLHWADLLKISKKEQPGGNLKQIKVYNISYEIFHKYATDYLIKLKKKKN